MRKFSVIYTAFIWSALATMATATPDREVKVEEQVLGSNSDGFILLRTEVDNLGSHYAFRTKRFLVEYSKVPKHPDYEGDLCAEIRSDLLLDVTTHLDVDNPTDEKAKTTTVNAQNENVKLADLLSRFPNKPEPWDKEKFGKLTSHPTSGPCFGRVNLAWGGWIKERFGVDRNAKLEWTMSEAFEDGNCLYLSVRTKEEGQGEQWGQRIVAIPPRKTKQVHDHLFMQPVYLIAGDFESLDEAIRRARELNGKTHDQFKCEVWSFDGGWAKLHYVVADSSSTYHIDTNQFEAIQKLTGFHFTVMSSQRFCERFAVPPLAPGAKLNDKQSGESNQAKAAGSP